MTDALANILIQSGAFGVAIGMIWLVWQVWKRSNETTEKLTQAYTQTTEKMTEGYTQTTERMINVAERSAQAVQELKASVDASVKASERLERTVTEWLLERSEDERVYK